MNKYDRVYKACLDIYSGSKVKDYTKYDQFKGKSHYFESMIHDKDKFNDLYMLLKNSPLRTIIRTPSGGIASRFIHTAGAWDYDIYRDSKGNFKGVRITVIMRKTIFKFKIGNLRAKDSKLSGALAFKFFKDECIKNDINLEDYEIKDKEEALQIKETIESPIIRCYKQGHEYNHVYHLDLNAAWPSEVSKVYPEFKNVFTVLRKRDKLIADIALGYMQSNKFNYKLANLSKIGVNGCNKRILELASNLAGAGYTVLSINTDGIWYQSKQKDYYHDDDEGTELGQWKTDHKDCKWFGWSDGNYYFYEDGKFNCRARGYYTMDKLKPDRSTWTVEDFFEAMLSQKVVWWEEERGIQIYG